MSTAKTLRLRSALTALSGAASSVTTASISVPIVEHCGHILRSNSAPRTSKTSASRPRPKASAARASQGVPRCGRRSNGTFVIDWNSLCYGLSYKLDRSTPPSAAQVKTRVNSNSGQRPRAIALAGPGRAQFCGLRAGSSSSALRRSTLRICGARGMRTGTLEWLRASLGRWRIGCCTTLECCDRRAGAAVLGGGTPRRYGCSWWGRSRT